MTANPVVRMKRLRPVEAGGGGQRGENHMARLDTQTGCLQNASFYPASILGANSPHLPLQPPETGKMWCARAPVSTHARTREGVVGGVDSRGQSGVALGL